MVPTFGFEHLFSDLGNLLLSLRAREDEVVCCVAISGDIRIELRELCVAYRDVLEYVKSLPTRS